MLNSCLLPAARAAAKASRVSRTAPSPIACTWMLKPRLPASAMNAFMLGGRDVELADGLAGLAAGVVVGLEQCGGLRGILEHAVGEQLDEVGAEQRIGEPGAQSLRVARIPRGVDSSLVPKATVTRAVSSWSFASSA